MLRNSLIAAMAFTLSAPSTSIEPTPFLVDNNIIPKIECGGMVGTGVFVGPGLIATANHLASVGDCTVNGATATPVQAGGGLDFALLEIADKGNMRALIDCGGFHEGERYLATGYALNANQTVTQGLTGTRAIVRKVGFAGESVLRGSISQGMSGGPINRLDNGATVGIVNANTQFGVTRVLGLPFSATSLCKGNA
jgi:hypothetical protein